MQKDDFAEATQMFHAGQYENGLQKISNCILVNPEYSMLYSNRALFYYQIKSHEKAIEDLQIAIQKNYLNYIAYFNLFSIELRIGGLQKEALQDLCCSLSVLYFMRAKIHKTQIDVQKSLKYCQNNTEAHILKGMMHLENNKLKLARNQIAWALQFEPENIVLKRLKHYINQKIGNFQDQDQQNQHYQNPFQSKESYKPNKRSRLQCSYQIDENTNFQQQLSLKLREFTEIYNDLNFENGTITQRILIQNDQNLGTQTSILSQISGIWEGSKNQKMLVKNGQFKQQQQKIKIENQKQSPQKDKQQQIIIYDNIVLKQFDLEEDQNSRNEQNYIENKTIEENQYSINDFDQINKNSNISSQFMQRSSQFIEKSSQFKQRPSQRIDYFTLNQRQDLLQSEHQESMQIPYEIINKKFNKKQDSKQSSNQHIIQNQQNFIEQSNFLSGQNTQLKSSQALFVLPQPQRLQKSQSINSQKNSKCGHLPSIAQCRSSQRGTNKQKFLTQLQQTGNTGHQMDQLSDAILSYSSQTKIASNYGQILRKQNKNIKFHQSQVMQKQFQQIDFPVHQIDQNGQITLIDDLISQSSHKAKQNLDISSHFVKKESLQQKLKQIKQRVIKSLDNSVKKVDNQLVKNQLNTKSEQIPNHVTKFQHIQLYPFTKKQIFFNFVNIQFSKKYKVTQLDQVYLVGVYHLSIPKYKMKTQSHKLDNHSCNWNEKFPQINLLQQPRFLKITVFNRAKGRNARDELLGEAQKQITQTGEFKVPLYEKKILVGHVNYAIWAL